MYIPTTVLLAAALLVVACALAGLANAVLHYADGATWPAAARAGGRAGLAVAGVLLAVIGLVVAAGGL
ncbi:hypothetical protein MXD62_36240 [Frankia sp. Mgl5]|uniref:hypothetical protein n=1 Tax=Frankia sp. Mgl5 TaxID=2933793 RepID=UPI00200CBF41|nr:hypothetical protein [Frankia sp. Mgl5]MCK9932531.1 hypothetical protein [Frankia sp. Mgl5]